MKDKEGYIAWLSELSKDDVPIAGGKGANLGEMFNLKLPVPQAFVVTVKAYNYFLSATGLEARIQKIIDSINVDDTKDLDVKAAEIRELVSSAEMPEDLRKEILEAYDNLNVDFASFKNMPNTLQALMKSARESIFVSVRSSATAEDLGGASFAGQQDSFINVKGNVEVIDKVKRVFASIFTARSIYYRKKKGFKGMVGIAAVVQKMINSDKSGVIFSVNPVDVDNKNIMVEAVFGQGEGIVSGRIKPDQYILSRDLEIISEQILDKKIAIVRDAQGTTKTIQLTPEKSKQKVLKGFEVKQLGDYALQLEKHYGSPQDIEFAMENDQIYIVQTRPITTLENKKESYEITGTPILHGMGASPGIASGPAKIVLAMKDLDKIKEGDVLVTTMTNPDMVVTMQKAAAIITDEGGITSHASIVSREMGIPCVVGTEIATSTIEEGKDVTVDGFKGNVYRGKSENKKVEVLPIVETKIKIKVSVDLPEFAERAAKTRAYGIGLVRLEGIIASGSKHPLQYEKEGKTSEYQELIKIGLEKIATAFINKEIWVRTSDIRSDEYSHLEGCPEVERNPMLGMHGVRFSLKHPEIFKAELLAIKELAEKGHKFGVMFPQVISVQEVAEAKQIIQELGMFDLVKFGIMVETPAAVMVIEDICKQGIKFISFGTNDLTQFTLAIDRGNDHVQYLYDEMNMAVLKSLSRVIRTCKQYKVETSICGQAANKKEMVEYLVKQGIDSLSLNADSANEISELVKKLEENN